MNLYEELIKNGKFDIYPFHMPGHKRRKMDFPNPYDIDITEIDGFDNLHHATGLIKNAQDMKILPEIGQQTAQSIQGLLIQAKDNQQHTAAEPRRHTADAYDDTLKKTNHTQRPLPPNRLHRRDTSILVDERKISSKETRKSCIFCIFPKECAARSDRSGRQNYPLFITFRSTASRFLRVTRRELRVINTFWRGGLPPLPG